MMINKIEEFKCINCGRMFKRRTAKGNGRYIKGIRGFKTLTCSTKCSKEYQKLKTPSFAR